MRLPVDAITASGARVFFLTSPNAPTGVGSRTPTLLGSSEASAASSSWMRPTPPLRARTPWGCSRGHPNLVVVRTLSKAYALAGIRVGYALGRADVIEVIDKVRDSYNVSRLSQAAALAALGDPDYYRGVVDRIRATRDCYSGRWAEKRGWFTFPPRRTSSARSPGLCGPHGSLRRPVRVRFPLLAQGVGAPLPERRLDRPRVCGSPSARGRDARPR